MALPVTIPNTFANATASIPLSQLDANFNTLANAVNGISDGSETLANASVTVLTAGTVDINGGAIDGTTVGTSNAAAGSFTTLNTSGAVVFNDAGADVDFRVEGDTDANLLFVDASADKVGVGTNAPSASYGKLTVAGTGITIADDGNAKFQIGRYSAGVPNSYIKMGANSNSLRFSNPADNADLMTLDSNGNVLVGTTSPAIGSGPGIKSQPAGDGADLPIFGITTGGSTSATAPLQIYSTGAGAYRFYVSANGEINATITSIAAISDQRFKENIRDLDDGLSSIMALQPRKFDWKEGKGQDIKNARGFIAQEFEQVFPDLISEWKDPAPEGEEPYKSVRQDLIPVLVKAIQELKAELDTVKAELATLKG